MLLLCAPCVCVLFTLASRVPLFWNNIEHSYLCVCVCVSVIMSFVPFFWNKSKRVWSKNNAI